MSKVLGYSMTISVLATLMIMFAQDARAGSSGGLGGPGCPPPPHYDIKR